MIGMKKIKNHVFLGVFSALACEALFGLSYLFTKQATQASSALALLGWRFFVAFIVMLILAKFGLISVNFKGKKLGNLIWIGLFSPVLYFIGETIAINLTTASESGAFLASIPVVSLLASSLILKQRPTISQISGILITLSGVLVTVFAVGARASFSLPGYFFLFLAVVSYALYCVYVEKTEHVTSLEITFFMIGMGFILFTSLAVLEAIFQHQVLEFLLLPMTNISFLSAILYQGIACSVLAFFLSNFAISQIGVNHTASFIGVSTLVSILSGLLFLGESFSLFQLFGAILILLGVYLSNRG